MTTKFVNTKEQIDLENNDNSRDVEVWQKIKSYQLSAEDIIANVTAICQRQGVSHLYLFGSYAAGNPTFTSDIDFVVKGCRDIGALEDEVDKIPTLTKIDLFDYDNIRNANLLKDIDCYAKKIY